MSHLYIIRIFSISLILIGLLLLLPFQYAWVQQKRAVASQPATGVVIQDNTLPDVPELVSGHPTRLVIPSLNIDIAIQDGTYNTATGDWTLSEKAAHFALPSALPNNLTGNTLVYGHYNKYVFKKLGTIAAGAEAHVITAEGYTFIYSFTSAEVVSPTNTDVFAYNEASRLTLQTCSGKFMQNRHLHYFSFVRYEKI